MESGIDIPAVGDCSAFRAREIKSKKDKMPVYEKEVAVIPGF